VSTKKLAKKTVLKNEIPEKNKSKKTLIKKQTKLKKLTTKKQQKPKKVTNQKQQKPKKIITQKQTKSSKAKASKHSGGMLTHRVLAMRDEEIPSKLKIKKTKRMFRRLTSEEVFRSCSLSQAQIDFTKKEDPSYEIISQTRAVRAISFGLGVQKPGYNIYVAGVQGTGKTSVIRSFLQKSSQGQGTPGDWVYVYNFKSPENPKAFELEHGQAKKFKKHMDELVGQLEVEIPDALQSEDYENNVNAVVNLSNEKKTKLFSELEKTAKGMNFGVKSTRMGIVTVPIIEGKPLSEKDYGDLTEDQKEKIESDRNQLEPEVLDFARKVRTIEQETKSKLEALRSEIGDYVVSQAMSPLVKEYEDNEFIIEYLDEVKEHILENLEGFVDDDDEDGEEDSAPHLPHAKKSDEFLFYRVNVFVDNTEAHGAPIVIENNPTFYNLFGKIEKNIEYGVYTTDFKMIKSGALAKANGGYLVLNVVDVLKNPQVWDTLKRVLKNQKLYIEDLGEQYSILPTSGLRPEPIPLNVKIVLIGSDWIYRMLYQHDEDFNKVFKIKADFDTEMPRNQKTVQDYIRFIATRTKVENLLPCSVGAIEAMVEFSSRVVDDQDRLTTRFSLVKDLTIEADFIAKEGNARSIAREHVEKAIDERHFRSALIEDRMAEMIQRGDILISVSSRRIGEINGLAVYSLGDVSFGIPSRITCRTYKGKPGLVNIERDSSLSGRLHNKGVSILQSWIMATFAKRKPIVLAATICFEQNYSGVDGDSATLAEMILVMSTIAEIPIDQGIAVTGSVNQFGEVQPVGGINEKIEGFFRACKIKGFTGRQGVVIPIQNMKHLMLSRAVRHAIEEHQFHVWPVSRIEEAFELLTGFEAGSWLEAKHAFTPGSAFECVAHALKQPVKVPTKKSKSSQLK
jgi:lon-related putative ATP-dependent protease